MYRFNEIARTVWTVFQYIIVFSFKTIGFVLDSLITFGLFFIGGAVIGNHTK